MRTHTLVHEQDGQHVVIVTQRVFGLGTEPDT